jgi:hypothetical protein
MNEAVQSKAEEYRARAKACAERARQATDAETRRELERQEEEWLLLAVQAECPL